MSLTNIWVSSCLLPFSPSLSLLLPFSSSLPGSEYSENQILLKGNPGSFNSHRIFSNCILLPSFRAKSCQSSCTGPAQLAPSHRRCPICEDANAPLWCLPPSAMCALESHCIFPPWWLMWLEQMTLLAGGSGQARSTAWIRLSVYQISWISLPPPPPPPLCRLSQRQPTGGASSHPQTFTLPPAPLGALSSQLVAPTSRCF